MKDFNINMSEFDLLDPNNYTEEKNPILSTLFHTFIIWYIWISFVFVLFHLFSSNNLLMCLVVTSYFLANCLQDKPELKSFIIF